MAKINEQGEHLSTLLTALSWGVLVAKEKFHFLPPWPPLLKMFIHHMIEGDGAL